MNGRLTFLVDKLNEYRDAYYNKNETLVTDAKYDELFDELQKLEEETGIILANSPTQTVGYTVQSKLNKVLHDHPMLSLGKTKEVADVVKFIANNWAVFSLKMDGLTCSLHYNSDGYLDKAETRGNGTVGEDILENAKQLSNIPLRINNGGTELTVDGEVIVDYATFNLINDNLESKFSHPRNLASGSIRQLDTKITKERNLKFIAWKLVDGFDDNSFAKRLQHLMGLGFEVVPFNLLHTTDTTLSYQPEVAAQMTIDTLRTIAKDKDYPIDGIVITYDDVAYGESRGETTHHPLHSLAYKWANEAYETKLLNIEWQVGRSGVLTPVAVVEPVEVDGCIIERASLSNISVLKDKLGKPFVGQTVYVSRRNQVIPYIERAEKLE